MNTKTVTRKKRTDRTHIIYMIESGADFYIGVTAKTESTVKKSVITRCRKHFYRMRSEDKSWMLYETMRERGVSGSDGGRGQDNSHANRGWPTRHGSRGARVPPRAALEGVKGGKGNRWGRCGFHGEQTWMVLGCVGEGG